MASNGAPAAAGAVSGGTGDGPDGGSGRPIGIVEVGPRDGLQNEATLVSTPVKLELIRRALEAGVRRIEVASFVHPRLVPQMADAEAVMAGVHADGFLPPGVAAADVTFIGLVLNPRGLARALATGVDEVNVVVAASEGFARANQNSTVDALVSAAGEIASRARAGGVKVSAVISTAFGCPFDGEVAPEAVLAVARRLIDSGVQELAVADTIGVGVPAQVRGLIGLLAPVAGGVRLRAHFHNTRNTGYANALAAVESGVAVLDASVGGIGGCPFAPNATGNIATEDLVYLLHRSGYPTGLDLAGLADTGVWIGDRLGRQAPALLGRAGGFPTA